MDNILAVDYDGDPIPEHALVTLQNDKLSTYKRLTDALAAQGYIVTLNDTFDTLTALSDGEPVHISLDRPEEELLNEYGGQR